MMYALDIESVTFERLKKKLASRKLVYYLVPIFKCRALFKQTNKFSTRETIQSVRKFISIIQLVSETLSSSA